ncbi:MAG TPA: toll/interleukin-1 receptor domain-containing protein [Longimicrobium sp.]
MNEPTAFVSYSWDSDDHKQWVRSLAERLRGDGVDVTLDLWHLAPGDQLPEFMERAIRGNDYVLIVCTPRYKARSDSRTGGAGYEGDIMSAEVLTLRNQRKFIPIHRSGSWAEAAPSWLAGKYYIDLQGDPYSETQYNDLVVTLRGERTKAPPLVPRSVTSKSSPVLPEPTSAPASPEEPIRITGIIADGVGSPRNDGTRGGGLYSIPFRLSRQPDSDWASIFVATWDRPPRFTTMHRPGIARVYGDRVVLDGTTLEEIERYHRDTLKVVVERTNELYDEIQRERRRLAEAEQQRRREHEQHIRDMADRIRFD